MNNILLNDIPQMDFYRTLDKRTISLSFSPQSTDPQNIFFTMKYTSNVKYKFVFFFQNMTQKVAKKFHIFYVTCIFVTRLAFPRGKAFSLLPHSILPLLHDTFS